MTRRGDFQRLGHRHAFAVVQQGDGQVIGHTLLVMAEQHVTAGGQVGLLHQRLQVFHRLLGEGDEVLAVVQVLAQPTAERIGAGLALEQAPGLVRLGVVALVEVGHQVLDGLGVAQLGIARMQRRGVAVGLLVDQVDDGVANRHGGPGCSVPAPPHAAKRRRGGRIGKRQSLPDKAPGCATPISPPPAPAPRRARGGCGAAGAGGGSRS